MFDYSVNLAGRFKLSDICYELLAPYKEFGIADWELGTNPRRPSGNDFRLNSNNSALWFKFDEVHNFPFIEEHPQTKMKYQYFCRVIHKPNNSNYWHFEFHWFNALDGNKRVEVIRDKVRGLPKALIALVRAKYLQLSDPNTPKNIRKLSRASFDSRGLLFRLLG